MKIPVSEPIIDREELNAVIDTIKSGWITCGPKVAEFEKEFSKYCGGKLGIATNNGTNALHLTLATLGIKPGDEVIVPTSTFISCANVVMYQGAKPIFTDVDPKTFNITPEEFKKTITNRTKAVMVVHLYGHPADMDPIREIAENKGIVIIEDAAEAHCAKYKGRRAGSENITCYSFYANKIITTAEGGMIITNEKEFEEKAKMLRDHGMNQIRRYYHPVIGYNYRMVDVLAAVGLAQLKKIDIFNQIRIKNAKYLNEKLSRIVGITVPYEEDYAERSYWLYTILIEKEFGLNRDELMRFLAEKGIETRIFFPPIHLQEPYVEKFGYKTGMFPVAEELAKKGISLPSSTKLTKEQLDYIIKCFEDITTKKS